VRRVNRPDTWQHRLASQHAHATLANGEPSTHGYEPPVEANEGASAMRSRTGRFEAGAGARRHLKPGGARACGTPSLCSGTFGVGRPPVGGARYTAMAGVACAASARASAPGRVRASAAACSNSPRAYIARAWPSKSEALATLARANSSSVISGRCNGRTLDRADRDRRSGDARRKRWGACPTGASLRRSRCP
jgi:hypothetical protein